MISAYIYLVTDDAGHLSRTSHPEEIPVADPEELQEQLIEMCDFPPMKETYLMIGEVFEEDYPAIESLLDVHYRYAWYEEETQLHSFAAMWNSSSNDIAKMLIESRVKDGMRIKDLLIQGPEMLAE